MSKRTVWGGMCLWGVGGALGVGCASGGGTTAEPGPVPIGPEDSSLIEFDPLARPALPESVAMTDWQRTLIVGWGVRRGVLVAKMFEAKPISGAQLISIEIAGERAVDEEKTSRYTLSPTAKIKYAGIGFDVDGSGELELRRSEKNPRIWAVESGWMLFEGAGKWAKMTIRGDGASAVVLEQSGEGVFDLLVELEMSDPMWDLVTRNTWWMRGPVEVEQGRLTMRIGVEGTEWMYPYEPAANSDYDRDGTYDFEADRAAFLAAWEAKELRADINHDSAFDEADIFVWEERFRKDVEGFSVDAKLGRIRP